MATKDLIEFAPWYGELGWEVMTWAPMCRITAQYFNKSSITSFADSEALYTDFATEFIDHGQKRRSLNYHKNYRAKGLYHRYGHSERAAYHCDILLHARGIRRKANINYQNWSELIELLKAYPWSIGWIGTADDQSMGTCGLDLRGQSMAMLMDIMAASKVVIGVSSGIMHLSAACGTNLIVWGDRRTYFGETLEKRYKHTWNPFSIRVGWIDADDWQPQPQRILKEIERILT